MGLKIVTQTNEQECGVCALASIHNHYYKEQVVKEQVLDKCHISNNGLSIFDLETLGNKLGLECESYEVKYSEFINIKINNYFILLLATGCNKNHYVVAKKKKKYLEIYDSCSSEMKKMTYEQLKSFYADIVILVKNKPNNLYKKAFGKATTLLMIDLKFVLLNLLLSMIILAISVGSASFLNYVIDLAINKSSINNLITICFIFILHYLTNNIFSFVSQIYMSQHTKAYFMLFTSKILSSLRNKNLTFINKVDKSWIYKVDQCVHNITNFTIVEINKFITNIVLCFACICIIGSIQYWLLIFVLFYILVEFIFFLFSYRKKKEVYLPIIRSENANADLYKNLIYSLENELWASKRNHIVEKIKNNYSSLYKNFSSVISYKNNLSLFKSALKSFVEVCWIGFMSYLIIKTNTLSLGRLTFLISAFGLFKNSVDGLTVYPLEKLEFDIYWQVYKDLTTVANVSRSNSLSINNKFDEMVFFWDDKKICVSTVKEKQKLPLPIIDIIKNSTKVEVDGKKVVLDQEIINNFIVISDKTMADVGILVENITKSPQSYAQYLKYFNIDVDNQTPGFYHKLIISLICLLEEKGKIIFLDRINNYIKKEDKLIVNQIINKIKTNNIVVIVGGENG